MAKIKIRGRLEPIEIENEKAQKVKDRKFGFNGVEKAEPTDLVDLGEWAGEYSRIVEIEMTKTSSTRDYAAEKQEREEQERKEQWLKMSPETKAEQIGWFKLAYSMRLGQFKTDPPENVIKEVTARLVKFYTENPTAETYPHSLTEDLLPKKGNTQTLAEKMKMNGDSERVCKNPNCDNKLPHHVKDFCSGKCMLESKNGQLSTE